MCIDHTSTCIIILHVPLCHASHGVFIRPTSSSSEQTHEEDVSLTQRLTY